MKLPHWLRHEWTMWRPAMDGWYQIRSCKVCGLARLRVIT